MIEYRKFNLTAVIYRLKELQYSHFKEFHYFFYRPFKHINLSENKAFVTDTSSKQMVINSDIINSFDSLVKVIVLHESISLSSDEIDSLIQALEKDYLEEYSTFINEQITTNNKLSSLYNKNDTYTIDKPLSFIIVSYVLNLCKKQTTNNPLPFHDINEYDELRFLSNFEYLTTIDELAELDNSDASAKILGGRAIYCNLNNYTNAHNNFNIFCEFVSVIIHELCHFHHTEHNIEFYKLMESVGFQIDWDTKFDDNKDEWYYKTTMGKELTYEIQILFNNIQKLEHNKYVIDYNTSKQYYYELTRPNLLLRVIADKLESEIIVFLIGSLFGKKFAPKLKRFYYIPFSRTQKEYCGLPLDSGVFYMDVKKNKSYSNELYINSLLCKTFTEIIELLINSVFIIYIKYENLSIEECFSKFRKNSILSYSEGKVVFTASVYADIEKYYKDELTILENQFLYIA